MPQCFRSNNLLQRRLHLRSIFRPGFRLPNNLLFFLTFLLMMGDVHAATINLCDLLSSAPSGGTVTLNSTDTYQLTAECIVSKSVTIFGNGFTIQGTGPLRAQGEGVTLTIDHCMINSTGWAALAAKAGSKAIAKNSSAISCPPGTGIYAEAGSTLTVQNSSITSSQYGVQITKASTGVLQGTIITGCYYPVLVTGASNSFFRKPG